MAGSDLNTTVVSLDGIGIITNNSKTCATQITQAQLDAIYEGRSALDGTGTVTNPPTQWTWHEVWSNCSSTDNIKPYSRNDLSGTHDYFLGSSGINAYQNPTNNPDGSKNFQFEQAEITVDGITRPATNGAMAIAIQNDTDGLGYVGFAFQSGVNVLNYSLVSSSAWNNANGSGLGTAPGLLDSYNKPTVSTIQSWYTNGLSNSGSYNFARKLYMFSLPQADATTTSRGYNPLTQTYLNFVTGPSGTDTGVIAGYVQVPGRTIVLSWDINHDNNCDVSDLARIGLQWNAKAPASQEATPERPIVNGWIPEDNNNDGIVHVSDLATVGLHWGSPCK